MSTAERWLDRLLLENPAQYDRLLHAYFRLLGDRRPWWQRAALADHPGSHDAISATVAVLAKRSNVDPQRLMAWLEQPAFAQTRKLALDTASHLVEVA